MCLSIFLVITILPVKCWCANRRLGGGDTEVVLILRDTLDLCAIKGRGTCKNTILFYFTIAVKRVVKKILDVFVVNSAISLA